MKYILWADEETCRDKEKLARPGLLKKTNRNDSKPTKQPVRTNIRQWIDCLVHTNVFVDM